MLDGTKAAPALTGRERYFLMSKQFNNDLRIWVEEDGTIVPTGCVGCGQPEKNHGWYSFCFKTSGGYYLAPSNALILERMKHNRKIRTDR